MGRHSAPEIGAPTADEAAETQVIPVVATPDPRRAPTLRLLTIAAVAVALLLGTVVWAVSSTPKTVLTRTAPAGLPADRPAPVVIWSSGPAPSPTSPPSAVAISGATRTVRPPVATTSAPAPSPSPSPSPSPARSLQISRQSGAWPGGYSGRYTITNTGPVAVTGWTVVFTFAGTTSGASWDASPQYWQGTTVTLGPVSDNRTVPAGGSVSFGINANAAPKGCRLNGNPC